MFGTFDFLKSQMTGGRGLLSSGQRMVCGLGAGVTEAVLVVTWIETLKVNSENNCLILMKIIVCLALSR